MLGRRITLLAPQARPERFRLGFLLPFRRTGSQDGERFELVHLADPAWEESIESSLRPYCVPFCRADVCKMQMESDRVDGNMSGHVFFRISMVYVCWFLSGVQLCGIAPERFSV